VVSGPASDGQAKQGVRVGVIGAGSWGTTAAIVCTASQGACATTLWARSAATVDEINGSRTNARYLPGVNLPAAIRATTDISDLVAKSDILVMAVPSHGFREILSQVRDADKSDGFYQKPIVSLAKGLEAGSWARMSEVAAQVCPHNQFAVLTGPNLAGEIAQGQPTASVVASTDVEVATRVQSAFNGPRFRVYLNDDVVGCEVAGVVKNVIALGVGIADGFGLGHNSRAALITRGLAEITRLGVALGGQPETFAGLAGMGDLIATCYSTQSRNNSVGRRLGMGESLQAIVSSMAMVAEGVKSAPSVLELARKHNVAMPIVEQVVNICENRASVPDVISALLSRSVGSE
jgi:glycerol-3-phosphate dehydrogenase (NAD(P)+)